MANTILLKRSGTAGKVPVTANLSLGELSINYTDGRLYTTNGSAIVDLSQNDKITLSGDATGTSTNPSAGSGYSNLAVTLSTSGVTAGVYGSTTQIPQFTVDAKGRVTAASNVSISTSFTLAAGSGSGTVSGGGTLTVSGGTGITTSVTGSTYTITNSGVTSIAGTAGQITASGSTGSVTLSLPSTLTLSTVNASSINAATIGNVGTTFSGAGATLTGNVAVTNTIYGQGLYDNGNRVLSTSSGAGNLSISGTAVTLPATGPGPTTVGSASAIPVVTTDAYGRVTALTTASAYVSSTGGPGNLSVSSGNITLPLSGPGLLSAQGSSTAIPVISTDAYGRITALTTAAVIAPAGTLSGTTLASGVVNSSLTSVGTLTSLTVSGTTQLQGNVQVTGGGEFVTNNLIVTGNLYVSGNSTTVNSTSVTTNDLYFVAAGNAATAAAANGAGLITPYSAFTFNSTNTAWASNIALYATALYDNNNRVLTTATSHSNSGGDASVSGAYNALVLTLNTVNTNVGTFGNATYNQGITVNGKGLITGVTTTLITPAWSSITGTPTTLSGYGITDALSTSATIDGGSF